MSFGLSAWLPKPENPLVSTYYADADGAILSTGVLAWLAEDTQSTDQRLCRNRHFLFKVFKLITDTLDV